MPPRSRSPRRSAARADAGVDSVDLAADALVLTGPPDRVAGVVTIANTGTEALHLSAARVVHADRDDAPASLVASVAPGATHAAEVVAAYPPGTPPGTYAAHVDVAGQRRAARVIVEANAANTLRPNRIQLTGPTLETVDIELEITNTGNVDVPLALVVTAPLVVVVPFGIARGPELMMAFNGLDPFSIVVGPGRTQTLTATITLPQDLDRSKRHQALVPVGMADLRVFVLPRDLDTKAAPRAATRRSTRTATRAGTRRSTSKEST